MKKMTKLFALIAAMAVAFSLVACSNNKPTDSTVTEVESIKINDIELNTTDKDVAIEYTLMPEGAEGEVTMSIADDTIATIKDGKISAVSEGETELLISVGEIAEVARVTVKDADKGEAIEIGRRFEKLGYTIYATRSTAKALNDAGVKARKVNKINQESPTVMDLILGHKIDLVIDTPTQGRDKSRDGFLIRRTSIETGVNCLTAMDTAKALATSLENKNDNPLTLVNIAEI